MRIALTGGSGKLGGVALATLREAGHDVVNLDRAAGSAAAEGDLVIDLGSFTDVRSALERAAPDAIVHLAAIPAPGLAPENDTFENNMLATWHVFQAARELGVRRIVHASSETVLGLPFDVPPPYLPVDEEYAPRPESVYSLVKTLEEAMDAQLARWDPELSITALRFSNVMLESDYAGFPAFDDDLATRRWNLWGYIDARDGAEAIRLALETRGPGFETFVIAAADTVSGLPTLQLATEMFPDVPITRALGEHETLLSIDKARRMLGYTPAHSWRMHV